MGLGLFIFLYIHHVLLQNVSLSYSIDDKKKYMGAVSHNVPIALHGHFTGSL